MWAPHAEKVELVGDFNGWDGSDYEMTRNEPNGIYDIFVPGVKLGQLYKYKIFTQDGRCLLYTSRCV